MSQRREKNLAVVYVSKETARHRDAKPNGLYFTAVVFLSFFFFFEA